MTEERKDRRSDPERVEQSVALDRRDSPRLLMPFRVRADAAHPFMDCEGDVSLGGAFYSADVPPVPNLVDFRIELPAAQDGSTEAVEIGCKASVVRTHREDTGAWGIHLAFQDMSLEHEQALARFLDAFLLSKKG
ncbi:MAG: PilZ domain-containing protein [Myxococcales bacterium]|jgi:hypothetical protein|nr:PilZ domain-containing protein [Myxococcales bacterium]